MNSVRGTGPGVQAISWLDGRVIVACLIAFHVLLPLDRGFPTIPIFGRPLNVSIAATSSVLLVLIVQTRGAVLSYLREPYCVMQLLYAGMLVVGALRAPSTLVALHWSTLYFSTFVLNYVILRHVTRLHGFAWLVNVVVGLGIAAAVVGIFQSIVRTPLPMYDAWYESYFSRPPQDYSLATSRATGTMSNPILYGLLMALVVPYALEVKNRVVRAMALFTIMFAVALSGSRTAVLIVGVFAGGAFVVYRWRAVRALPAVGLGLVLLVASLIWLTPMGQDSRVALLAERFAFIIDPDGVATKSSAVIVPTPGGTQTASSAGAAAFAEAPDEGAARRVPGVESTQKAPAPMDTRARTEAYAALGVSLRQQVVIEAAREMVHEWDPTTWTIGRGTYTVSSVGTRIQPWYNTVDNVFVSVLYERGLVGLALFVGAFVTFLAVARRSATVTVHWFAPLALAAAGLSFCWDAYSMFNILVIGSMAIAMAYRDRSRDAAPDQRPAGGVDAASVGADEVSSRRLGQE